MHPIIQWTRFSSAIVTLLFTVVVVAKKRTELILTKEQGQEITCTHSSYVGLIPFLTKKWVNITLCHKISLIKKKHNPHRA